ncbi:MAG: hypothetical protein M3303_12775 [Gemmatimonadota bacterium]|nr:hypothetical protein [Gemmatimonadota bacterium]
MATSTLTPIVRGSAGTGGSAVIPLRAVAVAACGSGPRHANPLENVRVANLLVAREHEVEPILEALQRGADGDALVDRSGGRPPARIAFPLRHGVGDLGVRQHAKEPPAALALPKLPDLQADGPRDQLAEGEAAAAVVGAGQAGDGPAVERPPLLSEDARFDEHSGCRGGETREDDCAASGGSQYVWSNLKEFSRLQMPGLTDLQALSPDKKALLLDIGQFTLDIIGIFEPTPFSDLTNAVVSLVRADVSGALMSGGGVVPVVGDVAKLGKIPRHVATVERGVSIARTDARFAALLRPMLGRLLRALDRLPADRLSLPVKQAVERLQRTIGAFLGRGGRAVSRVDLDKLTDDVLRRVLGSTKTVGMLPRKNVRTVVEFFDRHNVAAKDPAQWAELIRGIDLHAVEPVGVVRFKAGDLVAQYVETSRPADRQIGQWMVRAQGAVSNRNVGLSGAGRSRKVFRVKKEVEVLQSKAAGAADHWTTGGTKPHTAVAVDQGRRVMKPAEQVAGGGDQYFLPRAWEVLEDIK